MMNHTELLALIDRMSGPSRDDENDDLNLLLEEIMAAAENMTEAEASELYDRALRYDPTASDVAAYVRDTIRDYTTWDLL